MNQYPLWKYILILLVVTIGTIYALPNLDGEDPAVQVTSARGFNLPQNLTATIDDSLADEQITYKSREQVGNRILYRFNNTVDQLNRPGYRWRMCATNAQHSHVQTSQEIRIPCVVETLICFGARCGEPVRRSQVHVRREFSITFNRRRSAD